MPGANAGTGHSLADDIRCGGHDGGLTHDPSGRGAPIANAAANITARTAGFKRRPERKMIRAITATMPATTAAKFGRMKLGKSREKSLCQIVERVSPTKFSPFWMWKSRHGYAIPCATRATVHAAAARIGAAAIRCQSA